MYLNDAINKTDAALSIAIENRLVDLNPRGMKFVQAALKEGYCQRSAQLIADNLDQVLIGTGFPVNGSYETDGPVGAIALYNAIYALRGNATIACSDPLYSAIKADYKAIQLPQNQIAERKQHAERLLNDFKPSVIVAIEMPGLTDGNRYFNMRHDDISQHCASFDACLDLATCPTVAIGDGGNEIGMGNVAEKIASLDIRSSLTLCDELLIADVSNWASYGIIAFLSKWSGLDLLSNIQTTDVFQYLSDRGSVDGVTGENTLTEDGMAAVHGQQLIQDLRALIFR